MGTNEKVTDKVVKELPEFVEEVASLSVEQLNDRLAQFAKDSEAVDDAKEADEALAEAREVAAQLAAPYADSKKVLKLKTRYIIGLIKDKGGK